MMQLRKSLWLLTLLSLSVNWLQAERVFILFDNACMNRLEYKQAGQPGSYVVYQVNVAPGERIVLEVGQEGGEYRGNMPNPLIGCSTGIFDAQMVDHINRGMDEVFVVNRLSNGRHTISQVSLAASYQFNQKMISFDSPKYQFRFDLENGTIGENIATGSQQREVFFEGRMEEQCKGAYIFRQFAPRSAKPHMDLVMIPDVGIIEERAGFTLDEALSNALKMENINGIPFDNYLSQLCSGADGATSSNLRLTPYNAEVTPGRVFAEQPDMSIKGTNTNNTNAAVEAPATSAAAVGAASASMHTISAGETLYSLAKKYGVSVNDLKKWNGLKSNTIYKGRQLVVSDPDLAAAPGTASKVSSIASGNPGATGPVPYSDTGQRLNMTVKGVGSTEKLHTVRTGETVASIAMKYGYTETRFREINGLKANEYPKIGQQLKTTDCDCPDVPMESNVPASASIDPYAPVTTAAPSAYDNLPANNTPVNNFSYPSPSAYDQNGQAVNSNTRPFANYSDTPVPATGSLTAPATYNNYNTTNTNTYNNQPTDYSNFNTGNTSIRGVDSYQSNGLKRSHVVKDNETLYDIARQYGTTVQNLRQLNRLDANEVVIPNQRIYLE